MKVIANNTDITNYISTMSWGGSINEVSRKLTLSVINPVQDKNITPVVVSLGQIVYLYDGDNKELFRGYVIDREANSQNGTVSYTCYDMLYYLTKSKLTHNFGTATAEDITKQMCSTYEVPVGNVAKTGISQKLKVTNCTLYEVIMKAYSQASVPTGKKYYVNSTKGKLNVEEIGKHISKTRLTEDTNITSSKYTETLSNMINRVKIYNSAGTQTGEVSSTDTKYGLFQTTYTQESGKDATTEAKALLHGIDKTFSLECLNNNEVKAGWGAYILDDTTGLSGLVWINSDTHTYQNGVETMSLVVTLEKIMDTKEVTE